MSKDEREGTSKTEGSDTKYRRARFVLTRILEDKSMVELVKETDHKTLALWASDCAERVTPHFEEQYPEDHRPQDALKTLKRWIDTGLVEMDVIRNASLAAHAAARDVRENNPARSAARAAGHAVATAHVRTHSMGAAIYAQQAVYRAADPPEADAPVARERDWQLEHLRELGTVNLSPIASCGTAPP